MDYLDFFGLTTEPFSMAPVSRFYFNSAQHSRALVRLMYAVDTMKGLAVLIGDIGTGKTTLARRMLDSLPEEEYESALLVIIHSGITADWLLERIALQLGVREPEKEKLKLLSQLYKRLVELHNQKKKAVVLIDEAQMLQTREIMEEFRGLLNLEMPENKLITFVFFGLPEIDDNLKLDQPLAQRVALKYTLEAFNEDSTRGYIQHRLRLAGSHEEIFEPQAAMLVHHYSRGIPRLINTICDNALFEGYLLRLKKIDAHLISNVVSDLGLAREEDDVDALESQQVVAGAVTRADQLSPARQKVAPRTAPPSKNQPVASRKPVVPAAGPSAPQKAPDNFDNIIVKEHKGAPEPAVVGEAEQDNDLDLLLDDLEEK